MSTVTQTQPMFDYVIRATVSGYKENIRIETSAPDYETAKSQIWGALPDWNSQLWVLYCEEIHDISEYQEEKTLVG